MIKINDKLFSYLSKTTRMLSANFIAFNTNKVFEESAKSRWFICSNWRYIYLIEYSTFLSRFSIWNIFQRCRYCMIVSRLSKHKLFRKLGEWQMAVAFINILRVNSFVLFVAFLQKFFFSAWSWLENSNCSKKIEIILNDFESCWIKP